MSRERWWDRWSTGAGCSSITSAAWPYDIPNGRWSGPPLDEGAAIMLSPVVPDEWRPLVEPCLAVDPKRRPKAHELPALIPDIAARSADGRPPKAPSRTETVDTLPPGRGHSTRAKVLAAAVASTMVVAIVAIVLVTFSNGNDGEGGPTVGAALGAALPGAPDTVPGR